jgi:hypothetical protein
MTQTVTPDNDIQAWSLRLREALAAAPADSVAAARAREMANRARSNGTLTVNMLRLLVNTLDKADKAVPAPKPEPQMVRRNKYAQECERCGAEVEAEKGILERSDDDTRWMVSHPEGECPVLMFEGVPEGRYAINWGTVEVEDVKFYQVRQATLFAQASAELWAIKDTEAIAKVLDAVKADPKAASVLYGLKLGQCGVCGRTLTNQESRDIGIGPICRDKMGW